MKANGNRFLMLALSAVVALALPACSRSQNSTVAAASEADSAAIPSPMIAPLNGAVPTSVQNAFQEVEQVSDQANGRDWNGAASTFSTLQTNVTQVHNDLKSITGANDARAQAVKTKESTVDSGMITLNDALRGHDRDAAMRASDGIARPLTDLALMYLSKTTGDLMRLKYYSRAFDIAASTDDVGRIKDTADAVLRTWNELRPEVEAHGGATEEVRHFNDLVDQLAQNSTPPGQLGGILRVQVQEIEDALNR